MTFLRYISIILLLSAVVSCQTTKNQTYDELTPAEYKKLVKKVRKFIAVAPMRLTPISNSDKQFIYSNKPKFHPTYCGDKGGIFKMTWKINPGYSVRIIGKGYFLQNSCKLRLTVARFAQ